MSNEEKLMDCVRAARGGDRSALEPLFEKLLPELRGFVRANTGQHLRAREPVSDMVQTICREVLHDLGQFEGEGEQQFRKWLFTLARHKIRGKHRFHGAACRAASREVVPRAKDEGDDHLLECYRSLGTPSRAAVTHEEVARIEAVFDSMPEDYQRVITLACFASLPHADVAQAMGRSEPAARKLLSRARAHLALRLAQSES